MCELVGIGVSALSKSATSPSSSREVNSATVCLLSSMLHQSHLFSSSNTTSILTKNFSCWGSYSLCAFILSLHLSTPSFGFYHQVSWYMALQSKHVLHSQELLDARSEVSYQTILNKGHECPRSSSPNNLEDKLHVVLSRPKKLSGLAWFWVSFLQYSLWYIFFSQPHHFTVAQWR